MKLCPPSVSSKLKWWTFHWWIQFRDIWWASTVSVFQLPNRQLTERKKKPAKKNGYPERFLNNCFKTFLTTVSRPAVKPHTAPKLLISLVLPFTEDHCLQIHNQVTKLLYLAYPHIQLCAVFRPICRVSIFFVFKDRLPITMRSCVVYKITCRSCQASYLGQTFRLLHIRMSEHMGISTYTEKPFPSQDYPAFSHLKNKLAMMFSLMILKLYLPLPINWMPSYGKAY